MDANLLGDCLKRSSTAACLERYGLYRHKVGLQVTVYDPVRGRGLVQVARLGLVHRFGQLYI